MESIFLASGTTRGSAVYTPSTSVRISHTSASRAAARATAVVSEPPRPRVVISRRSGSTPWKPATMTTLSLGQRIAHPLPVILADPGLAMRGVGEDPRLGPRVADGGHPPGVRAMASSAIVIRSPAVRSMSISRGGGLGLIAAAKGKQFSVV